MAGAWRLARSLETLRSQVNKAYPNRNKASDGTIGDASHAASASDHNPNRNGVVTALDLTHDPKNGFDAGKFAEHLRTHRHPNLRYIIFNRRIAGWWNNWQWEAAVGHERHVHVSVGTLGVGDGQTYDRYDNTQAWSINVKEDDMFNIIGDAHKYLIRVISSEVKGWDSKKVHSGVYDEKEMKHWKGKKISDFSQQAWNEGADYRKQKAAWQAAYNELPKVREALNKANAALNTAQNSSAVTGALEKKLAEAQKTVEAQSKKLTQLEADKAQSEEVGNAFVRWIGKILSNNK